MITGTGVHDRRDWAFTIKRNLCSRSTGPRNKGLGKPEPLKGDLAQWLLRRIVGEQRLVYRVEGKRGAEQRVEILQCRFHY
jgi:Txe/YoeB family toxin of toxin-antitoxin system